MSLTVGVNSSVASIGESTQLSSTRGMPLLGWRRWPEWDLERVMGEKLLGGAANVRFGFGRLYSAREVDLEIGSAAPNRISGGTDDEKSRSIGPKGIAVTGTSISEAGLASLKISYGPFRYPTSIAVTGVPLTGGLAVRFGEKASGADATGIVSLGRLRRLLCGA